jgi:hypothetical protein
LTAAQHEYVLEDIIIPPCSQNNTDTLFEYLKNMYSSVSPDWLTGYYLGTYHLCCNVYPNDFNPKTRPFYTGVQNSKMRSGPNARIVYVDYNERTLFEQFAHNYSDGLTCVFQLPRVWNTTVSNFVALCRTQNNVLCCTPPWTESMYIVYRVDEISSVRSAVMKYIDNSTYQFFTKDYVIANLPKIPAFESVDVLATWLDILPTPLSESEMYILE